jgi:hypothetical protein
LGLARDVRTPSAAALLRNRLDLDPCLADAALDERAGHAALPDGK